MITELDLIRTRLDARRDLLQEYLKVPVMATMTKKQVHIQHVAHAYMQDAARKIDAAENSDLKCLKLAVTTTQEIVDRLWSAEKHMLDDKFGMS